MKADFEEEVGKLKRRAEMALEVGKGQLVDSSGGILDVCAPIKRARLQNGDSLTLRIRSVHVQATPGAFAAVLGDGSTETWGNAFYDGGDSSAAQNQLENVQQVQAVRGHYGEGGALAAILADGSVVTWAMLTTVVTAVLYRIS